MIATLLAQGAAPAGGPLGSLQQFVPLILIFVVFYFMLIRPQQKKAREQQDWLKAIKKGDEVYTVGGLVGKVVILTDSVITIECGDNKVRLKVLRSHVSGKAPAPGQAAPEPDAKVS